MAHLWAVVGDKNTDSNGGLTLSGDSTTGTVYIGGIEVIVGVTNASADDLCDPVGPPHCDPYSTTYSGTVFAYGKGAHRKDDSRVCGATTVVTNQSTVFCD
jgi:uncharacterized Zn-binding protein involved in type VI secretion